MICTIADARRIIARYYGDDFAASIRFTPSGVSVYVRPSWETDFGKPTLCSRKLLPGKDSTVWIGRLSSGGGIDWAWDSEVRS